MGEEWPDQVTAVWKAAHDIGKARMRDVEQAFQPAVPALGIEYNGPRSWQEDGRSAKTDAAHRFADALYTESRMGTAGTGSPSASKERAGPILDSV